MFCYNNELVNEDNPKQIIWLSRDSALLNRIRHYQCAIPCKNLICLTFRMRIKRVCMENGNQCDVILPMKSYVHGHPQATIIINCERVIVTSQRHKRLSIVSLRQWIIQWRQYKTKKSTRNSMYLQSQSINKKTGYNRK